MAIGGVVINFAAKTADAIRDVNKFSGSLSDLGDDADKASGRGGRGGILGLVSSMGAAVPIVGAVAIGVVGAATGMIDMARAAWEDKQQSDRLADTLGRIPGVTQAMIDKNEEWITSMQLATLVSDTELREAVSKLTLATGDLSEAQTLAALSADVAAGTGRTFASVATAMAAAAAGNTTQLKKMFPWLDKNKDGTLTLAEATEGLGDKFEGAAGQAAKNDPWKRIGIIWEELKEIIGTTLLPILEKLSDWFSKPANQQKIQDFLERMQEIADVVGGVLKDALDDLIAWLKKPANQQKLEEWAEKAAAFARAMGDVAEAIVSVIGWLNRLPDPPSWLFGAIGIAARSSRSSAASPAAAGTKSGATATTAAAPQQPPTVIVTEEQIARAIMGVLLKSQARNGRVVMVG